MLSEFAEAVKTDNRIKTRKQRALNNDLRAIIESETLRAIEQTRPIAEKFNAGSATASAQKLHNFVRKNFVYLQDSPKLQQVKLPSALLRDLTGDCKSFSLFIYSILHNLKIPVAYKYASYTGSGIPSHIYTVIQDNGEEIVVDGTSNQFNYEREPRHSFTKIVDTMKVQTLSSESLTVLAEEVLADETLTSEASKKFMQKLKGMAPGQRRNFLKRFTPKNRGKLVKSIKSYSKLQQLKRAENAINGSEVYALGFSDYGQYDSANEIAEQALAGKKERKQKRATKLAKRAEKAKPGSLKQKRLQASSKKAAAKASGDKKALQVAKQERKGVAKERAKKVGKVLAKVNPVLAAGRGAFLGMVAINLRGFAKGMANMIAKKEDAPLRKKWEAIGGKYDKLLKAINRGKNKKALLGSGKISEEVLAYQVGEGINLEPATTAAATTAVAAPVIAAILPIVKKFLDKTGAGNAASSALTKTLGEVKSPESKSNFQQILQKASAIIPGNQVADKEAEQIEERAEEVTAGEDAAATGDGIDTRQRLKELLAEGKTPQEAAKLLQEEREEQGYTTTEDTGSNAGLWLMGLGLGAFGLVYAMDKKKKAA